MNRREIIEANVKTLVARFLYYDRKEDEDLPRDAIQEAIEAGEISAHDIASLFSSELHARLGITPA